MKVPVHEIYITVVTMGHCRKDPCPCMEETENTPYIVHTLCTSDLPQ